MTDAALDVSLRRVEPEHRRTHAEVRRNSMLAGGRWESRFASKLSWRNADSIYLAAEITDQRSKKPRDRRGCIGLEGLKILRFMLRQLRSTGRFDMAYATIASKLRIAPSCVKAAMARLRDAGFVAWVRRCKPTGRQGERGPQYEQTSNLYRAVLPEAGRKLLDSLPARKALRPPAQDDQAHQAATAKAASVWRGLASPEEPPPSQSPATSNVSPEMRAWLSASPRRGHHP